MKSKVFICIVLMIFMFPFSNVSASSAKCYLEYPTENSFIGDTLYVQGWLMSDDANSSIKIFIDGNLIDVELFRTKRNDVISAISGYGGILTNPSPGFNGTSKLNNYSNGAHSVSMVAYDSLGIKQTECVKNVIINDKIARMYLDYPYVNSVFGDELVVEGWLMSTVSNGDFHIYIDGREMDFTLSRRERPDVIKAISGYGDGKINPTPGFSISTSLTSVSQGVHELKLNYTKKDGTILEQQTKLITVEKNIAKMYVDYPKNKSLFGDELIINGWLMSTISNGDFHVYIDEQEISFTLSRRERPDVIKAISGYGDEKINSTPGFTIKADLNGFQNGIHKITLSYVTGQNEIIVHQDFLIEIAKNLGRMYLDYPKTTDVSSKVEVSGWILTPVQKYQLLLYVDDHVVDTEFVRRSRIDVVNAISGYGGSALNQEPGFSTILDLSNYYDGEHYIEVVALSNDNTVISQVGKTVNLSKFLTKSYLDRPSANYQLNNTDLLIRGWVLTECSDYKIQLWIDDTYVKEITNRTNRVDVLNAFGSMFKDTSLNQKPGYESMIDLSSYPDGSHKVVVKVVQTSTNEILNLDSSVISLQKYRNDIELEQSQNVNGTILNVSGWYMTEANSISLKFYIDGSEVNIDNFKRVDRNDIISRFGEKYILENQNKQPGFLGNINLNGYKDGQHTIKVEAINQDTNEVLIEDTSVFQLDKYDSDMYIDYPKNNVSGVNMEISGWYLTTSSSNELKFYIDGQEVILSNLSRRSRDDVLEVYKGKYDASKLSDLPGFGGTVDVSSYCDGSHTITVQLINTVTNEILIESNRIFNLKKYDGWLVLEYPKNSNFSSDSSLYIQGWELSESNSSKVKIYLDNEELEVNRSERIDVTNAYPNYYGGSTVNATPGYTASYDLKYVSSGEHILKVELYSTDNDKIAMITKKVIVYSDIYFGIDVSSHQGNINWSEVKKSGIDFAILRLGYGDNFSSQDDRTFINNVNGCVENNIPYGVYLYSYALSKNGDNSLNVDSESIDSEIAHTLRILNSLNANQKSNLKLPVFLDMEDDSTVKLGKDVLTSMADHYCTNIQNNGYKCGIYANKNWFNNYLDGSYLGSKYDIWLAHYTDDYNNFSDYNGIYQIWQYTSGGSLGGISSSGLDMDISFKKYW